MNKLVRTTGENPEFQSLVRELDSYLEGINGNKNSFFVAHNTSLAIPTVVVLYRNDEPVACGAFKEFSSQTVEIKRMFVKETHRNRGCAKLILDELLLWAKELGHQTAVLETAKAMTAATSFYQKQNFTVIENFGPYVGVQTSVCFMKKL